MSARETVRRQSRRRGQLVIGYGVNGNAALKPQVINDEEAPVLLSKKAPVERKPVKPARKPKLFTFAVVAMTLAIIGLMIIASYGSSKLAVAQRDIISTEKQLDAALTQQKSDLLEINMAQNIEDMKKQAEMLGLHYPEAGQVQSIAVAGTDKEDIKSADASASGDETDYLSLILHLLD